MSIRSNPTLYKVMIHYDALYACEKCTITKTEGQKLTRFERKGVWQIVCT